MTLDFRKLILMNALFFATVCIHSAPSQSLMVESLSGPVTQNEINGFKAYLRENTTAPAYHGGNLWVFGEPGRLIEACGHMYEVTQDLEILDHMIVLTDAALADRNDLLPAGEGGQLIAWTGKVEPIWPSTKGGITPAGAGVEQGRVLSHIAYCAKLILETPSICEKKASNGDPHGFGITYKERAIRYVKESDEVIDRWILPHFIRTSENYRYYFPGAPNTYKVNEPAPWNQAWMLTDAFVRLTQCHVLLKDAPSRIVQYDAIVKPNIDWFMQSLTPNKSASGSVCWKWLYSLAQTNCEDSNHAAYDVEGLYLAYTSGRYGLQFSDMVPFANTYFDIVLKTVSENGKFSGRLDGTTGVGNAGGDNFVREEYLYLADFRPEQFEVMGNIEIKTGKVASSALINARLLWQKHRLMLQKKQNH